MTEPLEYLIIMTNHSDQQIEGYYLLSDTAMADADEAPDYWDYLSTEALWGGKMVSLDGRVHRFNSVSDLATFMVAQKVVLEGEWADVTY